MGKIITEIFDLMKVYNNFKGVVVSIVTYNNQNVIKDAIESIIKYTDGIDYMIVVFDNNSTDNTLEIIKEINNERIDVISSKKNYGFGYGHNRNAEKYPNASYYLIYNPDLFLKENLIKAFFDRMEKDGQYGMLVPKVKYPDGSLQYLCKRNPTIFDLFMRRFLKGCSFEFLRNRQYYYEMRDKDYNNNFELEYASGCCMFINGELYRKINGFDEHIFMYLEDADITRTINQYKKTLYVSDVEVMHLWGKGAHHSLKLMLINIMSAVYYFNKWGWKIV